MNLSINFTTSTRKEGIANDRCAMSEGRKKEKPRSKRNCYLGGLKGVRREVEGEDLQESCVFGRTFAERFYSAIPTR